MLTPVERFKEKANRAHLLEYWEASYRTPHPSTGVVPFLWKWEDMKSLLVDASETIGIMEAERRGLFLGNPGLNGQPYATPTLLSDIQLLKPGERAPAHRHTSSASRLFMEGTGAYTTVEGEKCFMDRGDLVINPSWAWHDHGNEGDEDIVYLNVLDVPLVSTLGSIFYDHDYEKESDKEKNFQSIRKPVNESQYLYATGGMFPKFQRRPHKQTIHSPQLIYRWQPAREMLENMKAYTGDPFDGIILEYINPETGGSVTPTMAFSLQLLRAKQPTEKHRHTSSTIYWVVEGRGYTETDGGHLEWSQNDVFALPSWEWHRHVALDKGGDAVLLAVTDEPAVKTFGLYREEAMQANGDVVPVERH